MTILAVRSTYRSRWRGRGRSCWQPGHRLARYLWGMAGSQWDLLEQGLLVGRP